MQILNEPAYTGAAYFILKLFINDNIYIGFIEKKSHNILFVLSRRLFSEYYINYSLKNRDTKF